MQVGELKSALERLESLYAVGGAAPAAKDLRSIAQLLVGHEHKSVEQFIAETNELLSRPSNPKAATINETQVAEYASRLLAAGQDRNIFDAVLAEIDSDALIGKGEWVRIANRYRNAPSNATHEYSFKSTKEARAAIRDAFIERHEASSKRGIIDRLTKWAS